MKVRTLLLKCLTLLAVCTTAHAAQYTIRDLGTLPGGNYAGAEGINNLGEVVGYSDYASDGNRAFLWDGTMHPLSVPDYPPKPGPSAALCINDVGQIGGSYSPVGSNGACPAIWQDGQCELIPLGPVRVSSGVIYAVNNLGWIVGTGSAYGSGTSTGFLRSPDGSVTNLNSQLGAQTLEAYDVNDNCVVVGWFSSGGMGHAFALDAKPGNGDYLDLGVLTGMTSSWARAINGSGQVVGTSDTRAFLWDGTMHDLGVLVGATSSTAYDVNNAGWIVGSSAAPGSTHAFLSDGTTMYDLDDLAGADSVGWDFEVATSINNAGQIVGYGTHDGKQASFLLTPVPEPSAILALLSGLAGIGGMAIGRRW